MNIYIDFAKGKIEKVTPAPIYFGDNNVDKITLYFKNIADGVEWYPTLSALCSDNNPIYPRLFDTDGTGTKTIDGVDYTYYEFTLSSANGWNLTPGRTLFYVWVNYPNTNGNKCVGTFGCTILGTSGYYKVDNLVVNPELREYLETSFQQHYNEVDEKFEELSNNINTSFNELEEEFNDEYTEEVNAQRNLINNLIGGEPRYVNTSSNILALTSNKGVAVATDNGHWFYWDGEQYVDSGIPYQATEITDKSVDYRSLSNLLSDSIVENELDNTTWTDGYFIHPNGQPTANADYSYSDFIIVDNTLPYIMTTPGFVSEYSRNNDSYFIRTISCVTPQVINLRSNTTCVRVSTSSKTITKFGYLKSDYIEYGKIGFPQLNSLLTNSIIKDDNDGLSYTDDYIIYSPSHGQPTAFSGYSYSDFIPVNSKLKYLMTENGFINQYATNDNSSYISTTSVTSKGYYSLNSNCKYVRLSVETFAKNRLKFGAKLVDINALNENTTLIEVGTGKQFTTLKSAVAYGNTLTTNVKMIVYAGNYDLATEFATEIANHSGTGLRLENNYDITFMAGSYVTCLLDGTDSWASTNFEPIRMTTYNITLRGLNIKASNTRYCVHDDQNHNATPYYHKYENCRMEFTNNIESVPFIQCIGGGMGYKGYIDIDGGWYKCNSTYVPSGLTEDTMEIVISFHNGQESACDGKIFIKNVYCANKGYMRFGYYGTSTIKTPVEVCGCSMKYEVALVQENSSYNTVNFDVISYNNEIRTS